MALSIATLPMRNVAMLSSSFSGAALGVASKTNKSVKLVAFQVRASGSDSQEAVRQFALRGFQAKRALKVSSTLSQLVRAHEDQWACVLKLLFVLLWIWKGTVFRATAAVLQGIFLNDNRLLH